MYVTQIDGIDGLDYTYLPALRRFVAACKTAVHPAKEIVFRLRGDVINCHRQRF